MVAQISNTENVTWSGQVVAVQTRIRLTRSFEKRSYSYLGYLLRIDITHGGQASEFMIAVDEGTHEKHRFQTGMEQCGHSMPVEEPCKETAALYKTSGIKVVKDAEGKTPTGPPFLGAPPKLEAYRNRGHNRLDIRTFKVKCTAYTWGC